MNKFFFSFAMFVLVFSFSSCSLNDDNGEDNRFTIDPVNWMEAQFLFDDKGTMKYVPTNVFKSKEEMQQALVGKAWKHSFSYRIYNNTGKVENTEYYSSMYGPTPYHYYFYDKGNLYAMAYSDKKGGQYFADRREWSYDEVNCVVKGKYPVWLDQPKYNTIQILEYDEKYQYIWLTQISGETLEDSGNTPIYVLSRYDLMKDEEFSPYLEIINRDMEWFRQNLQEK